MTDALWSFDDLANAAGGISDGAPEKLISGFSLDSRGLSLGDVFVALKDQRDGHEFVSSAFANGAAAALVAQDYPRQSGDGALIRVADTLRGLEAIGRAARSRLVPEARVIGVTGSAGKTGTKEMLRACCARLAPTHAADKSFNNHWGVPLTLARMPAATRFGVFEIGMNHPGEITPLSQMVRPHVAIITTVEAVHLEQFASVAEIAEAKAEIFAGVEPGGAAVLNRDNPHFDLLAQRAGERGVRVVSFGHHRDAQVRCVALDENGRGSVVTVVSGDAIALDYHVGIPGAHIAQNSLAVVAALLECGVSGEELEGALGALSDLQAPAGRGTRTEIAVPGGAILLIDESYNANPASMRAALAVLATVPRARYRRRIAVLGDMLELGGEAPALHASLKEAVDAAGTDLVFACGPQMSHLFEALPDGQRGAWAAQSSGIERALLETITAGDAVMIKGSNGSRMAPLVAAVKNKFAG
jgi:UDP-N-acetylmuramoyl-tripeptide--D-alanyl-D-alanine ligase